MRHRQGDVQPIEPSLAAFVTEFQAPPELGQHDLMSDQRARTAREAAEYERRLGIPALQSSDASMGVTNPGYRPGDKGATAFPASILVGSTFNPPLAREGGAAIGREARSRGFNIQLAGGINLQRDVRNGRNYEYYSEDPLVSALFGAEAVNGIQSEGVISTLKHYTLNANETNRHWLDAIIDPAAHRETDLLAFQIAIERSQPGAIMSGYNKINGEYASGNHHLLNEVLKGAWSYQGYGDSVARPADATVRVLTPRSTVGALAHGYRPLLHESALAT